MSLSAMVDFGIRVAKLRAAKGLSQAQLAERIGITKSMVSAYENSIRMPSYPVLIKIARVFNVSVDYLLGMENSPVLRTDGLTEKQIAVVQDVIDHMRKDTE